MEDFFEDEDRTCEACGEPLNEAGKCPFDDSEDDDE